MVSIVWRLEQMPVQALRVIPLQPLPKFASHEEELFARVPPHIAIKGTQVGELLPHVPRHFREQRSFAVDHLIMRERQHKVFVIGVHQRKGDIVLMIAPVDRIMAHVVQHIVHPAHIPLQTEAQTSHIDWASDHGPGC